MAKQTTDATPPVRITQTKGAKGMAKQTTEPTPPVRTKQTYGSNK